MTDGGSGEGASSSSMSNSGCDITSSSRSDRSVVQGPPDRRQFERYLSRLTSDIRVKEQELKNLLGHRTSAISAASATSIPDEISSAREQSRRCRKDREQYRQEVAVAQHRTEELKKLLVIKREEISRVEANYLFSKNEQKLSEQLRRYQTLYDDKQFTNIREETAIVQQIDKLRRNQKQLKKWRTMCEERDKLEAELKTWRGQMQMYHAKIRESRQNEQRYKETYKEGVQNVAARKKELDDLFSQKRRLIQDYNEKRQSYTDWRRSHPAEPTASADARSATTGGSRRQAHPSKLKRKSSGGVFGGGYSPGQQSAIRYGAGDESDSGSDGGTDFELFWEEKRACRSLVSYLQRIAQSTMLCLTPSTGSCESENQSTSTHHTSLSNASSLTEEQHSAADASLDETGGNLILLKRESGDEGGSASTGLSAVSDSQAAKRRVSKKDKSRKPHQAMSYDPQTLSRFDLVGVHPPLTVSDVPAAIENLKEKLKCYEDQTRMPPDTSSANYWFDAFGIPSHADRMISSESEMTTDSARFSLMTPSDADDSMSTTGLLSPDYATAAAITSPPLAGSLSFAMGDADEENAAVTTPLAAAVTGPLQAGTKGDQKMEIISEQDGKEIHEDEIILSRIPTYDEGIADLATGVASKDSSLGDSTNECTKEAAEIRKKLEQLKLEKE